MVKKVAALLVSLSFLWVVGCSTHIHNIGSGPSGNTQMEERQWYVLWGFVPINEVDSATMAGDAANYQIKTEASFIDVLIGMVAGIVTVNSRTVTVTK